MKKSRLLPTITASLLVLVILFAVSCKEETPVVVEVDGITLSPTSISLVEGEVGAIRATLSPGDATDKTVTWTSDDSTVAEVASGGLNASVKAVKPGKATITAKSGDVSAFATVEVTAKAVPVTGIRIEGDQFKELGAGDSMTLRAVLEPDGATERDGISWTSSNPQIVNISASGEEATITGRSVGEASITVKIKDFSASCTVSVTSVDLDMKTMKLELGGEPGKLVATPDPEDSTVTWSSSNPEVATVDRNGNVSAVSIGEADITAICGAAKAVCHVSVVEKIIPVETVSLGEDFTLAVGGERELEASITPADANNYGSVLWESSNEEVATVDQTGRVKTVGGGRATISATAGDITGSVVVTVQSITLDKETLSLEKGKNQTLVATALPDDSSVTWSSEDTAIATVGLDGTVTALANGKTTITATNGLASTSCEVTVFTRLIGLAIQGDDTRTMTVGNSVKLGVTMTPVDADDFEGVEWSSSDSDVVTVDAEGTVKAVSGGEATVTAKAVTSTGDVFSDSITVVVQSISLDRSSLTLGVGESQTIAATTWPADADVTWESSNQDVATVDNEGKVSALANGSVTITARNGLASATCTVDVVTYVSSVTIKGSSSITITTSDDTMPALEAEILPYDATYDEVVWTVVDGQDVIKLMVSGDYANVIPLSFGTASVTVSAGGVTSTPVTITVSPGSDRFYFPDWAIGSYSMKFAGVPSHIEFREDGSLWLYTPFSADQLDQNVGTDFNQTVTDSSWSVENDYGLSISFSYVDGIYSFASSGMSAECTPVESIPPVINVWSGEYTQDASVSVPEQFWGTYSTQMPGEVGSMEMTLVVSQTDIVGKVGMVEMSMLDSFADYTSGYCESLGVWKIEGSDPEGYRMACTLSWYGDLFMASFSQNEEGGYYFSGGYLLK